MRRYIKSTGRHASTVADAQRNWKQHQMCWRIDSTRGQKTLDQATSKQHWHGGGEGCKDRRSSSEIFGHHGWARLDLVERFKTRTRETMLPAIERPACWSRITPNAAPVGVRRRRKFYAIFTRRLQGQAFNQLRYRVRMSQASPCLVDQPHSYGVLPR
jgi:hypothetical protein